MRQHGVSKGEADHVESRLTRGVAWATSRRMTAIDTFAKPKLPPLHLTLLGVAAHLIPIRPGAIAAALRQAPRGDGHPVIVVPSFLRGDGHTQPLRRFLAGCGYAVEGWAQGTNLG